MPRDPFNSLCDFQISSSRTGRMFCLDRLEKDGIGTVSHLPLSIRIILESVLRNCDGDKITEEHVRQLANWQAGGPRSAEIPFVVARVVLQDFTGVPLLCDLAAMRDVAQQLGKDPQIIEPLVPVDLVVDHSVQVDFYGTPTALRQNMELEFSRNQERYQFMKWGMQAFETFKVIPPGIGIVHQVNLEYLFRGIQQQGDIYYPDTLVGTDSHTTMINSVGVVGWGVGGIEAEAAMLGQPVYLLTPDVVGVELSGALREGVTATDLVLTITEMLRKAQVVGQFVEFIGPGTATLSVTDRATIANMAPEYGATLGFFPIDEKTVTYLQNTGRTPEQVEAFEAYYRAQGMFGVPDSGQILYTRLLTLDLSTIVPSLAGPRRPQDRIPLPSMRENFNSLFSRPISEGGFNKKPADLSHRYPTHQSGVDLGHGDILIAAITSCTNTSNPTVMMMAGLLAEKAINRGLTVKPHIKTSLAPGSRVVIDYLGKAGLLAPLEQLGFAVVGFGCTTCIGNSGDLTRELNEAILTHDIIASAVLSGNRNFEARIHPNIRANYLASPPLVVAFALAGRVNINLEKEALGVDRSGKPVYLKDIWPDSDETTAVMQHALDPGTFRRLYGDFTADYDLWNDIAAPSGQVYDWPVSSYIARPPFFDGFSLQAGAIGNIIHAKALLVLGDSVTTDHISPAGSFKDTTPAGQYLTGHGVPKIEFNSYGSRRGNHEVMMRGTFANVRIKNLMLPPNADGSRIEGGYTLLDGHATSVYDAAVMHMARDTPTVIFGGEEYGTGSSRDWAAKGTRLLGVKAVIVKSFERIHRSNLVGMGVLPLQFIGEDSVQSLNITGNETFDIVGIDQNMQAQQLMTLVIHRVDGREEHVTLRSRIDTPIEIEYYRQGGILPYVLRELMARAPAMP